MIKNKKGEGYIDVVVAILIFSFILILSVNIVTLIVNKQDLKTVADKITDYAAINGTIDIDDYIDSLKDLYDIDFDYSFDGTELLDGLGKVQLGETIVLKIWYDTSFVGFGENIHYLILSASSSSLSQKYWK